MNKRYILSFLLIAVFLVSESCGEKAKPPVPYDEQACLSAILGNQEDEDQVNIDVYLDATESMKGYAVGSNCVFEEFLRKLESVGISRFANPTFRYYKFGTRVQPIERNEFLSAGDVSKRFYDDPSLNLRTYLDSVVSRASLSSLSIIITDLFPENRDINSLADKIKEHSIKRGLSIGLLGIKSQFSGMIYDASGPNYYYKSTQGNDDTYRPFYVLFFGNHNLISAFLERLVKENYVSEKNVLIISRYLVSQFNGKISYNSKDLMTLKSESQSSVFRMSGDKKNVPLTLEVSYSPIKWTEPFDKDQVELLVFRKSGNSTSKDSALCDDLRAQKIAKDDNVLRIDAIFTPPQQPNWYAYLIFLRVKPSDPSVPDWVREFSAKVVNSRENPNKTLNLVEFVENLLMSAHTIQAKEKKPLFIAKLNFTVERK